MQTSIQDDLERLSQQVAIIAKELSVLTHKNSQDPLRTNLSKAISTDIHTTSNSKLPVKPTFVRTPTLADSGDSWMNEEMLTNLRPSIYPHIPRRRDDVLTQERFHETDILDALRLDSFQGFYNLGALLLVFNVGYMTIRNILEKGWNVNLEPFACTEVYYDFALMAVIVTGCIFGAYAVFASTVLFVRKAISTSAYFSMYIAIQCALLLVPVIVLYNTHTAPLPSAATILVVAILMLKTHSYVATNFALRCQIHEKQLNEQSNNSLPSNSTKSSSQSSTRRRRKRSQRADDKADHAEVEPTHMAEKQISSFSTDLRTPTPVADDTESTHVATTSDEQVAEVIARRKKRAMREFPNNVTFNDFSYFMLAPTLVYEAYYPRTRHIRWGYVANKVMEICICFALQYFVAHQFMLPVLRSHQNPVWYDCLKLAFPSFLVWLLGFYCGFHSYLNLIAELTRFADREFYQDFWNSTTVEQFWRRWNIVVHEWCLRHIYVESMHYVNASRNMATTGTFVFSAFFHELISSVAFKTFRPWFFMGMLAQIPLVLISQRFRGHRRGNFIMWLSLFIMQPLIELLYFREWFAERDDFFCIERSGWFV